MDLFVNCEKIISLTDPRRIYFVIFLDCKFDRRKLYSHIIHIGVIVYRLYEHRYKDAVIILDWIIYFIVI